MALTPVQQVNLLIGNVPSNPFYPIFTDEEIQQFLDLTNQNVYQAARMAAISASFTIAGYSTRERTGDIEVWNDYAKNYLAALGNLINSPTTLIPMNLIPWSANKCPSKLMNIEICDGDNCREAICCEVGCGCDGCHPQGPQFEYPLV
jgi:hypothetical protein